MLLDERLAPRLEEGSHARTEEGIEESPEACPRPQTARGQEDREEGGPEGSPEERAAAHAAVPARRSADPAERHRPPEPAHGLHHAQSCRREALLHRPPRIPPLRAGSADELSLRPDRPFVQRRICLLY